MAGAEALVVALALIERPHAARLAQLSRLPAGVTLVLEIAAGDEQAIDKAGQLTGRSKMTLQKAAGFFIEQVLLHPGGDSYRILGCDRGKPLGELRRNMALIMRWMHPDVASSTSSGERLDRSLYTNRVTQAWETIKTEERRAAYNSSLAASDKFDPVQHATVQTEKASKIRRVSKGNARKRRARLVVERLEPLGFWNRLRMILGGADE
jgi:hypothetical protein